MEGKGWNKEKKSSSFYLMEGGALNAQLGPVYICYFRRFLHAGL